MPHLRSRRRQVAHRQIAGTTPRLRWLRPFSELSNSPVLVKLAAGSVPLVVVGLGLAILAAAVGPYTIPPSHSVEILLEQVGFGESSAPQTEQAIIETIRLPRILLALVPSEQP